MQKEWTFTPLEDFECIKTTLTNGENVSLKVKSGRISILSNISWWFFLRRGQTDAGFIYCYMFIWLDVVLSIKNWLK